MNGKGNKLRRRNVKENKEFRKENCSTSDEKVWSNKRRNKRESVSEYEGKIIYDEWFCKWKIKLFFFSFFRSERSKKMNREIWKSDKGMKEEKRNKIKNEGMSEELRNDEEMKEGRKEWTYEWMRKEWMTEARKEWMMNSVNECMNEKGMEEGTK